MDGVMKSEQPGPCAQCQRRGKIQRVRRLHESSLSLGDTAPSYTTTHSQSFCGVSVSGDRLIFRLRDPSFPSQHRSKLDLRDDGTPLCFPQQSHSKDVHGPKHVPARADLRMRHWALYLSGRSVRENITEPLCASSENKTQHVPERSWEQSSGKPTQWHQHDILTGEERKVNPEKSCRRTRDKQLWPSRRRETDHCALRLH